MPQIEVPRMLYRVPQDHDRNISDLESGRFAWCVVQTTEELETAQADGWHLDQYQAKAAAEAAAAPAPERAPADDNRPPTRPELEQKAAELGIAFSPRMSDKKLGEAIAAKLAG